MAAHSSIKQLEEDLRSSSDTLRASSKLNSNQYCMSVVGIIFLKYAYGRYKKVEAELLKDRSTRGGVPLPVTERDFQAKSALYLPREAQYDFLLNLPENIASANISDEEGRRLSKLGDVVKYSVRLIEQQSEHLKGILPKTYNDFSNELLAKLIRIFNNDKLEDVGGDIWGRIFEYFRGKFAKSVADDGAFFTPKSLVQMIVNIIEPNHGTVLDPACGSGGMFVQSGDFVNNQGMNANSALTFYGQEKADVHAHLCLMNMAVHGLNVKIKSADITDLSVAIHNIISDDVGTKPDGNLTGNRQFDISKIDFDLLHKEFAKMKHQNLVLNDIDELIKQRIEAMLRSNPNRINFYEEYQRIIQEYNIQQDRASIEKNFMALIDLSKSLDKEEKRFEREGFTDDVQLTIYDLLFKENISKSDIDKLKKVAVDLLVIVKNRIATLHNWREKETTTAIIGQLIHDTLYQELPESYDISEIEPYSNKLYEYIYERYPIVAA